MSRGAACSPHGRRPPSLSCLPTSEEREREGARGRKLGAQTHIKPKLDERLLPLLTTFERHVSLEGGTWFTLIPKAILFLLLLYKKKKKKKTKLKNNINRFVWASDYREGSASVDVPPLNTEHYNHHPTIRKTRCLCYCESSEKHN